MRLIETPLVKHGVRLKSLERFPGYLFGSDGSIWSDKVKGWRKLRPSFNGRYLHVSLTIAFRQQKTFDVHPLICEAFHGPCPEGFFTPRLEFSKAKEVDTENPSPSVASEDLTP